MEALVRALPMRQELIYVVPASFRLTMESQSGRVLIWIANPRVSHCGMSFEYSSFRQLTSNLNHNECLTNEWVVIRGKVARGFEAVNAVMHVTATLHLDYLYLLCAGNSVG
jgi:hypothetical protein